ncbi:uncharacterized protein LOC111946765 [Oryzias latipes]|uniref:uncharacterized protein LOC111946765 n=1 Tax=Oryzias latipes TaxID=8090 RepID=UPI000CE20EE1|nr:uncharacterized protein LOC111946765 [Oryzias latipes]
MTSMVLLLLQTLLLLPLVSASHHFGGTVGFSYKGTNPDGSFKVSFRNKATYDGCQFSHYWSCSRGNCGSTNGGQKTVIDSSSNAPIYNSQWCETETVETRTVGSDKPFELRVPENCPRSYKLMAFDPDGDRVRCRYGNYNDRECDGCDQPSGFHLDEDSCTLHYQQGSADPRVYGFEMVRTTLPPSPTSAASRWMWPTSTTPPPPTTTQTTTSPTTTTTQTTTSPTTSTRSTTRQSTTTAGHPPYTNTSPLSKLPLQFSLLVDPAVPSCKEGVYLPTFVHPTPADGARIKAEVNKEVEIKVKAEATHSVMQDLIMSGPSNISMHRSTHNEFVIRWTPMADDLGEHYPICFAVESATGSAISSFQTASYNHVHATAVSQSGVYQTEMRCVLVDVGKEQIKANVVCGESSMRVEIPKDSLTGLFEDHLELSDPTNTVCSLTTHSNSSHVIADFPLNACGTQIEEDDENLFFKNEITTVDDPSQLITRKHLMEISFYCQYAKKSNMTVGFTAHRKNITVWERGFGTFTYQFEFYPDSQYQAMIDPNSYPLEYELGSKIYMEIEASSSPNNTEMFVESCRASPYDNPNYHSTYTIIDNGCTVDPTVQIYAPSNQKQFRFSVEAFKFIGLHDQVYISCSVMVCEAGNPNTRCSQGCMNSSSSNDHHHIHKREAGVQSGAHFISQGPLRLHSDNSVSGKYGSPEEVSESVCEPDGVSSACLVSRDEPEPGLHGRMSSGCCGNDLWHGRLQDQNGPSPTSTSVPPLKAVRDLFS